MSNILGVIAAVKAVQQIQKAKQRIPKEYKEYSFFSQNDLWIYNLMLTENTCNDCIARAQPFFYYGNRIRGLFPYLEITSENRIEALVHPNCNCFLSRVVSEVKP
jgi:hypothetical protein